MKRTLIVVTATLGLLACKKDVPPEEAAVAPAAVPDQTATLTPATDVPVAVRRMVKNFQRVHFEFDSSTLDDVAKQALVDNILIMKDNPDIRVEVQGHADERGTTEYNLALGQRRADTVYKYMVAQGLSSSRLTVLSYGEEVPLVSGSDEVAWSKNRRAEFRITWDELGAAAGSVK